MLITIAVVSESITESLKFRTENEKARWISINDLRSAVDKDGEKCDFEIELGIWHSSEVV